VSGDFSAAEVEREVMTQSGKFIDLLITTRSFIVAVENKIDAALYNDLAEYSKYVDDHAHGRRAVKVVLCLSDGESCHPFIRVTYHSLFERVRFNLQSQTNRHRINKRYLDYLEDIMKAIDNLNRRGRTDQAFRKFVNKNEKNTVDLLNRVLAMKDEFHEKIRQLDRLIRTKDLKKAIHKSQTNEMQIYESLWLGYKTKEKAFVSVEAWISPSGWQVEAYREKDADRKFGIRRFDYDAPISVVANYSHELIESIKNAGHRVR